MHNRLVEHFLFVYEAPPTEEIVDPFLQLAKHLDALIDESPEKSAALRKLFDARNQALFARSLDIQNKARDQHVHEIAGSRPPLHPNPDGDIHG